MNNSDSVIQKPSIRIELWIIRGMMALMFLLTLFSGISIGGQFGYLYEIEITSQFEWLLSGSMSVRRIIMWLPVIISHAFVFSLIFLVGTRYFYRILIWGPIIYVLFFTMYGLFVIFGLIPFIIVWIVSLIVCRKLKYKHVKPGS